MVKVLLLTAGFAGSYQNFHLIVFLYADSD